MFWPVEHLCTFKHFPTRDKLKPARCAAFEVSRHVHMAARLAVNIARVIRHCGARSRFLSVLRNGNMMT